MSTFGKFTVALLAFVVLMYCSTTLQVSIAQAEQQRVAAAGATAVERGAATARWERAVESARRFAEPVAASADAAAEAAGTLATADEVAGLDTAVGALDRALEGRDIGAIAAARTAVRAAHAVFLEAVCANAETLVATNGSADQATKDAVSSAITRLRAAVADGSDADEPLADVRTTADRVVESHSANVAAAAAAVVAAAAAAGAEVGSTAAEDSSDATTGSTSPWIVPTQPPLALDLAGDWRPGCDIVLTAFDWWHPDARTGYLLLNPPYPYDFEVHEMDGIVIGVKTQPCLP